MFQLRINKFSRLIIHVCFQGRNWEGGRWGRVSSPEFHTLAKDISLNRGATHFILGHVLSHPITNIPAPPSQNYTVAPLNVLIPSCEE